MGTGIPPCSLALAPVLWASAALAGCQQTEGHASIRCATDNDEDWPGCPDLARSFAFEADFFALQTFSDTYSIRLQKGGKGADVSDGFHIQIMAVSEVDAECRLRGIAVEAPDLEATAPDRFPMCREGLRCTSPAGCPLVRVVARFPTTCPVTAAPLVGGDPSGAEDAPSSISFASLGDRPGDTVSGSFDLRMVDARTGTQAGRCLTGADGFSFVVKEGQPYVPFVE